MSLSLGLLSDYEFVRMVIWGVSLKQIKHKNKNYIGIHILPLFLFVVVHATVVQYVQRPVASLKIMSWNLFHAFIKLSIPKC